MQHFSIFCLMKNIILKGDTLDFAMLGVISTLNAGTITLR